MTGYPFPGYAPYPMAFQQPAVPPVVALVGQLGQRTWVHPNGQVMLNKPLIDRIARYREKAVPVLMAFLKSRIESPMNNRLAIIEGLYTAQKLAEANVPNIKRIYGITSRLNTSTDPLILTYLGGLYESLGEYEAFGPALSALVHRAVHHYPPYNPYQNLMADAPESLGGAVLEMVAKKTAQETVNQLKQQLRPDLFRHSFPAH